MKRLILYIAGLIFLAGCSTTKHLPEGEILYTGQKPMIVLNRSETSVGEIAMEEVEAALATAPNNSLLGSSTIRYPFPFGLWIYNGFQKYEKGFGKWIFNKFAATPVLMSTVNPDIRQKAAVNLLRDYGYFNGSVSYKTFIDPKDSLKAKLHGETMPTAQATASRSITSRKAYRCFSDNCLESFNNSFSKSFGKITAAA